MASTDKVMKGNLVATLRDWTNGQATTRGGNFYRVTASDVTVTTDDTKGVSPYNTSYGYTNITINTLNGGAVTTLPTVSVGITLQFECDGVLVVTSTYRNTRIRFSSTGSWIPVYANTSIAGGSSYLSDGSTRLLTYRTDQYSSGAFHVFTDNNTSYSPASLGQGYGTCTTAESTTAKVVTLSSYTLTTGGIVAVKFTYGVPANATMNINGKGAKSIYFKGSAITSGIINAGDVAYFIYSSQYHYLGKDTKFSTVSVSASGSATDEIEYITVDGVEKKIKSGSNAVWGNIGGTLSNQTDLNAALNDKVSYQDIVGTTGQATNKAISQKTFTDTVGNIESLLEALL